MRVSKNAYVYLEKGNPKYVTYPYTYYVYIIALKRVEIKTYSCHVNTLKQFKKINTFKS